MKKIQFQPQFDANDCGAACLKMVMNYHGHAVSMAEIQEAINISRQGVSLQSMRESAGKFGFIATGMILSLEELISLNGPCILHWNKNHFVVFSTAQKHALRSLQQPDKKLLQIVDPENGIQHLSRNEFLSHWVSFPEEGTGGKGIALILDGGTMNSANLHGKKIDHDPRKISTYFLPYRKYWFRIIFALLLGSILQLTFPLLTQSIVDFGIEYQETSFILMILLAQILLVVSQVAIEYLRNWMLLYLSARINVSILSDFLLRLIRMPIAFFERHLSGDILQRIGDHKRIEDFITNYMISFVFGLLSILILGLVLLFYSPLIFLVFFSATLLQLGWMVLFMKKRRVLDRQRFGLLSAHQDQLIQIVDGVGEIKLNQSESGIFRKWTSLQARIFRNNIQILVNAQYQQSGSVLISQVKNLTVIFFAAMAVIQGEITLGMMLAITFILGMINSPVEQMAVFLQVMQDARLSWTRMKEMQDVKTESDQQEGSVKVDGEHPICLENLSFSYPTSSYDFVLKGINLEIPPNQTLAIVGKSGSGKTTLLRMMLGLYRPGDGNIRIGKTPLNQMDLDHWRAQCGVVMQDGYLFADTIRENIIMQEYYDEAWFDEVLRLVSFREVVDRLPLADMTPVGVNGHSLSAGQRQRMLIARALYKKPQYLFLDEPTNALDTKNERIIMESIVNAQSKQTVIIAAHRLSTVIRAGKIIVLDQGRLVESGNHHELLDSKGLYYHLVKEQIFMEQQ